MSSTLAPENRFILARDGLRLHYLDYPCPDATRLPLVCLPGLARTANDFFLAAQAAQQSGRRVLALDYRGRGRSEWDKDWRHYAPDVEEDDIFAVLADAGVTEAVFFGTSRGGLHAMRIARARPGLIRAAVLNDIGPVIEKSGLLLIKGYVGKMPPLQKMSDAAALMRLTASAVFPAITPEQWEIFARQTFEEKDGKIALRYDPELAHTLDDITAECDVENLWEHFAALANVPILALRGEKSNILSVETLDEMARRAPQLERHTVPGQGHAPLLLDQPTIERVMQFLNKQS
ncbi:alpha/beta hydrolase [Methylocystis sp. MJC1]|uniref:alpha/beta fold hydrolase n=1 Tax=Methylocystis sp. MJC1 TaxID=2654282 RepID=UPI0013EC9253|nr:alpha/beta hydrolase [Methylocystis sp. MJC1]KAF2992631.1 2-(acetamidomethylene)succinate hydrolase [Methylocystis sp. MJC1]MBU6526598.1 alpha/beta hydrolase [Methylocystis sp. MJC1]UZX13043.1 alpha/beta hydrolase [Methylocystis sp. MJC1]